MSQLPDVLSQSDRYVESLTELLRAFEAGATLSQGEIVATVGDLAAVARQDQLGAAESVRLLMAMDRMSKFAEMLSNILKKLEDTSQSITQNLK